MSPKGWTGPKSVDGKKTEGSFRAHQVPMGEMEKPEHIHLLESWMRSYRPEELFDEHGGVRAVVREATPEGLRRMSANPHANGGILLRDLRMPRFQEYAINVPTPGSVVAESTRVQGELIRDVLNENPSNFRVFSPDETASNRWSAVFEATDRMLMADIHDDDDHVSREGRVMEMLSENQCQGWLEGYLLTGRHGFFSCYEAFIHIIDSMFNQHAKWLKVTREHPVAAAGRVAQLSARRHTSGGRITTASAIRTRASSITSSTRRRRSSASSCRLMRTACWR